MDTRATEIQDFILSPQPPDLLGRHECATMLSWGACSLVAGIWPDEATANGFTFLGLSDFDLFSDI